MSNDRSEVVDQPTATRVIEPERFHKSQKEPALLTDGEAGKAQYEQTMYMKRKAEEQSDNFHCTCCGASTNDPDGLNHTEWCKTNQGPTRKPRGQWLVRILLVLVVLATLNVLINGV